MAYATLEELKAELEISGTKHDAILQVKLEDAQAMLERIYRRRFEAPEQEETRYVDCTPPFVDPTRKVLLIPQEWEGLCRISSIVNGDGEEILVDKYVTVPRLRHVVEGASVQSTLGISAGVWPWWIIQLRGDSGLYWTYRGSPEEAIAITGHFTTFAVAPYEVRRATIRLAAWMYHQRDTLTDLPMPKASKDGVMLLPSHLPEDVQTLMKGLKRVM
jgi:hypothetical protein